MNFPSVGLSLSNQISGFVLWFLLLFRNRKIVTWFAEVLSQICAFLQVIYCDQACQKLHWFSHKKVCKMLQEQREKHEAESASRLQKQAKGIQTHCITMTFMRSIMALSCFWASYHGNTLVLTCSLGMLHISCTHVI